MHSAPLPNTLHVTKANTTLQPHHVYVSSSALISVTHSVEALLNDEHAHQMSAVIKVQCPSLCTEIIDNPYLTSIIDRLYILPAVPGLLSWTLELKALSYKSFKGKALVPSY